MDAAGKYELKLELFDKSGKRINLTDEGVMLKVPTIDGPFQPANSAYSVTHSRTSN